MKTLRLFFLAMLLVLGLNNVASAHYNSRLGRWLSRDPIGEAGGFNLYAYCGNDPVNGWDYLGLVEPPFKPQSILTDDQPWLEFPNYRLTFLLEQIRRANSINDWLVVQGNLVADTVDEIQFNKAALNFWGEHRNKIIRKEIYEFSGLGGQGFGGFLRRSPAEKTWRATVDSKWEDASKNLDRLNDRLETLAEEAAPWFDNNSELIGDLNGNGRIEGWHELSSRFDIIPIYGNLNDASLDFMNAAGAPGVVRGLLNLGRKGVLNFGSKISIISPRTFAKGGMSLADEMTVLRQAMTGNGNFGIGSASSVDAMRLGKAWVGNGSRVANDGRTLVSADGLRTFRPPTAKPNSPFATTGVQANFETLDRVMINGVWKLKVVRNGHLDITP